MRSQQMELSLMPFMKRVASWLIDVWIFTTPFLCLGLIVWAVGMMLVYVIGGIFVLGFLMAVSMASGGSGTYADDDESGWQRRPDDYNPATGLPMVGGFDTGGNPFGFDNNQRW